MQFAVIPVICIQILSLICLKPRFSQNCKEVHNSGFDIAKLINVVDRLQQVDGVFVKISHKNRVLHLP